MWDSQYSQTDRILAAHSLSDLLAGLEITFLGRGSIFQFFSAASIQRGRRNELRLPPDPSKLPRHAFPSWGIKNRVTMTPKGKIIPVETLDGVTLRSENTAEFSRETPPSAGCSAIKNRPTWPWHSGSLFFFFTVVNSRAEFLCVGLFFARVQTRQLHTFPSLPVIPKPAKEFLFCFYKGQKETPKFGQTTETRSTTWEHFGVPLTRY